MTTFNIFPVRFNSITPVEEGGEIVAEDADGVGRRPDVTTTTPDHQGAMTQVIAWLVKQFAGFGHHNRDVRQRSEFGTMCAQCVCIREDQR